jgi:hypothetical protein
MEHKICIKCNQSKTLEYFYKTKRNKTGYESKCKKCKNKYTIDNNKKLGKEYFRKVVKKHNDKNKDKIKIKNKKYWDLNKDYWLENDVRKEYMKEYMKINRGKLNKYLNERYKNNIQFKLGMILRQRFKSAIKGYKIHQIEDLISCPIEECKKHIEKQFHPEMTWENHGEIWEIDHIKPCASFDLTDIEQQKQCFHYMNYQPLFKTTKIAESFGYKDQIGNRNKNKYL